MGQGQASEVAFLLLNPCLSLGISLQDRLLVQVCAGLVRGEGRTDGEGPSGVTWVVCGECERPVPFSSRCPGPQRCACQELHRAQHSQHRLQRHLRGRQGRAEVNSRGVGVGAGVWGRLCTGSECPELGARTHPFSGSSLARRWQRSCVQAEGWGEQGFLGFSL